VLGQKNEDSPKLAVKICNDDGDGCQLRSVKSEHKILKKMTGTEGITQLVDFFEDTEDIVSTCYLVMNYAGSQNI
jgi:serine/threonine protein kinase